MTLAQVLAHFVCTTDPGSLDTKARVAAAGAISDCVGCMVAGIDTEVGQIVGRVAAGASGPGEARAVGRRESLSAQAAALANGAAAHALDYDDVSWTLYGHPSVAVLPAALAVADTVNASGSDLVFAYSIGVEVAAKIGRFANPRHYEHGWHATATVGVFGATAAACRLLGLDETRSAMALAIAASEASGVRRNFGSMTKPFHAGNAGRAGILAAELAREGMSADLFALEGAFGWFPTMLARSTPSAEELASALGSPWDVHNPGIALKRYPACGGTHCALDAILALKADHGFGSGDIEAIECYAHPLAKKVLIHPRPKTGLEGKFSMEYCLAVAAVDGRLGIAHFAPAWLADSRVEAMLRRTMFAERADLAVLPAADAVPAEVVVRLRDSRRFARTVTVPSGDPRNPMSASERRAKFLDCAAGALGNAAALRLWERLEEPDRVASVRALTDVLAAAKASPAGPGGVAAVRP